MSILHCMDNKSQHFPLTKTAQRAHVIGRTLRLIDCSPGGSLFSDGTGLRKNDHLLAADAMKD